MRNSLLAITSLVVLILFTIFFIYNSSSLSQGHVSIPQNSLIQARADFNELKNQIEISLNLSLNSNDLTSINNRFNSWWERYKKLPATPESEKLKKDFLKIRHHLLIATQLSKCIKNKEGLAKNIMTMMNSADSGLLDFNCQTDYTSIQKLISDTENMTKMATLVNFKKNLTSRVQKNAVSNIADMIYRVRDNTNDISIEKMAKESVDVLCEKTSWRCTPSHKKELLRVAKNHLQTLSNQNIQPNNYQSTAQKLNEKAAYLNRELHSTLQGHEGDTLNEKAEAAYRNYEEKFWNLTSQGEGLLVFSPSIKTQFGFLAPYKGYSNDKEGVPRLKGSGHGGVVDAYDVQNAKSEYLTQMREMGWSLDKISKTKLNPKLGSDEFKKNLILIVHANPLALAQLLLEDPSFIGLACELINETDEYATSLKNDKSWWGFSNQIAGGVLTVTGITLSFTGIGAAAGIPLTIVGIGLSSSEATRSGITALQTHRQLNHVTHGYLSGNTDITGLNEVKELKEEISHHVFNCALNVGFSAIGTASVVRGIKAVSPLLKESDNLATRLKAILSNQKHVPTIKQMTKHLGEEETGKLLGKLSALKTEQSEKILSQVSKLLKEKKLLQMEVMIQKISSLLEC